MRKQGMLGYCFSFSGEIGRKPYLLAWFTTMLLQVMALIVALTVIIVEDGGYTLAVGTFVLLVILPYISQLSFVVRRLRDAGFATEWSMLGPIVFLLMIATAAVYSYGAIFTDYIPVISENPELAFVDVMMLGTLLAILAPVANQLIYLLFLVPASIPKEELEQSETVLN